MILRRLLPVFLLLAMPALAQPESGAALPSQHGAPAPQPGSALSDLRVECVPASRARELIGKHGCVSGRVYSVTTSHSGATHVSLCPGHRKCSFHAVAPARDRRTVGDLTALRGKLVAVVGPVTHYRGHPQIIVRDRQQIQIAAGNPPPQSDVDQGNHASSSQSSSGAKHGLRR
jgi:hypothetical protein